MAVKNICMFEKLAGATLLIFANKQDLQGALSWEELAEVLDLGTLAADRHVKIFVPVLY